MEFFFLKNPIIIKFISQKKNNINKVPKPQIKNPCDTVIFSQYSPHFSFIEQSFIME